MNFTHNRFVLSRGIYPAAVTPFDENGRIDMPSVAKLLAWFEAAGCKGAVLGGTNGEGPSLSAVEKRDLLKAAMPLRGKLNLILGIATPSLDEAIWLCKQAANAEASAVLVMPPFYFREAGEEGHYEWFSRVLDASPAPVLVYNFPNRAGFTISASLLNRLSSHPQFLGAKDSSGSVENLTSYREALSPEKLLFVGNETLLLQALELGWSGSISGVANILPMWLTAILRDCDGGEKESAEAKFALVKPLIESMRKYPQPAMNKALLEREGIIGSGAVRVPLMRVGAEVEEAADLIRNVVGGMVVAAAAG